MTTFEFPVRVYYEDTDAGGVVYHSNYLSFMERARTEYLRSLGLEQDVLIAEHNIAFAVRAANIDFLKPARFNQALKVTVKLEKLGKASFVFFQTVQDAEDNALVYVTATIKIACIRGDGMRPTAIPSSLVESFKNEY